jgi:hypothetical protein
MKELELKKMHNATRTTVEGQRMSPLTTTAAAPARVIRSTVPSMRVLRFINPFVSMILRSPLHRVLSNRVLLTFTGRKTGKRFTIPVGYTREGDTLTLFSSKSWCKNLRSGGCVAMHLQGRGRTGRAEVIEAREAVLEAAEHLVAKHGLKEAGRRIGLALDTSPPPSRDELVLAMQGRVVIRLILDT